MRSSASPRTASGAIAGSILGIAFALAVIVAVVTPARADESENPVTWAVSPADETRPDGRSWVELELDPGATRTERLAVRNLGDRDVTFSLTAADGYFTPTGRFNMLPPEAESVGAGTWISVQEAVVVAAGATAIVPFTVTVPDDATPGDHAAGIAASVYLEGTGDGTTLGVESRVGFRVMTRVSGAITPDLSVTAHGIYMTSWNPFEPGSVEVVTVLENLGNVRLSAEGRVDRRGTPVPAPDGDDARPLELLPGDRQTVVIEVGEVWPLGLVTFPLTVEQAVVAPGGAAVPGDPFVIEVSVWAVPWPQLLSALALVLVAMGLLRGRRRRAKNVGRLLDAAREDGRRAALRAMADRRNGTFALTARGPGPAP